MGVLIGVPVFAEIYDLIRKLVRRGLQRHHKEELLEDENRIGEEVTETKPARLSPGEHLEQKLDERILRRELEAMEKAQEEEMKEKEPISCKIAAVSSKVRSWSPSPISSFNISGEFE